MAITTYIEPSADGATNAWTKSSGTSAAALLDDGVRNPTNARTAGDGGFITSSTDEQISDLVFPNTLTFDPTQVLTLWIYGSGGTRRAVDMQVSVNDGATWETRQTNVIPASAAATWVPWLIWWPFNQTHMDQLRIRLICNTTAGGGATAAQVDAVYLEQVIPQALTKTINDTASLSDTAITPAASFPTTGVLDDFNRTESPLSQGGAWGSVSGVTTNGTEALIGAGAFAVRDDLGALTDCEAWMTIGSTMIASYIVLRGSGAPPTNSGYSVVATAAGVGVQKVTSGANVTLVNFPVGLATGDKVGARVIGDVIDVFIKRAGDATWVQVGQVVDSTYSSGKIGLGGAFGGDRWTEFGGGPVAAGDAETAAPADTAALTDASTARAGKGLAESPTAADTSTRRAGKAAADAPTVADAASARPGKRPADTAALTDAPSIKPGKRPADTATATDAVTVRLGKRLAEAPTATDVARKAATHPLADTAALTDAATPQAGKSAFINDTAALVDASVKAAAHPLADTAALVDAAAKAAAHPLADTAALTDAARKAPAKAVADTAEVYDTDELPATDDFNRADTGPPPSASWAPAAGSATLSLPGRVVDNTLVGTQTDAYAGGSWIEGFTGDNVVAVTVIPASGVSGALNGDFTELYLEVHQGLDVPWTDGWGLGIYQTDWGDGSDNVFEIYELNAGVFSSPIVSTPLARSVAAGDRFAVQRVGNNVEAWRRSVGRGWERLGVGTLTGDHSSARYAHVIFSDYAGYELGVDDFSLIREAALPLVTHRAVGKSLADTGALSDALSKGFSRSLADTAALADAVTKAAAIIRGDTAQLSDAHTTDGGLRLTIADTITVAEDVGKAVAPLVEDAATLSENITHGGSVIPEAPITSLPTGGFPVILSFLGQALEPAIGGIVTEPATGGAPSEPRTGGIVSEPHTGGLDPDGSTGTIA